MNLPRFVIAGANSGVGKTTITIGLLNLLKRKGYNVQPFKSGPDYIDPAFHTFVTGNKSRNLDAWLIDEESIKYLFSKNSIDKDISVIEGVMGLFDGHSIYRDKGSTAHLSKIIKAPVLLIIDGSGISTSAAALVQGYSKFDKSVNVAGVLINNINGPKHYNILKTVIEEEAGIKCYGYLNKNKDISLNSRHLGLVPSVEVSKLREKIEKITDLMEESIDIEGIIELAKKSEKIDSKKPEKIEELFKDLRIGVASDKAFNFYYEDNLDLLEDMGAKLIKFSPIRDKTLAENLDGLYLGGGFPEIFAKELSENKTMLEAIKKFVEDDKPVYAECGGLMYMCSGIIDLENKEYEMVGVLKNKTHMEKRLQRFGYIDVKINGDSIISSGEINFKAHEFHRSKISLEKEDNLKYDIEKIRVGNQIENWKCGYSYKNFLGGYAHVHFFNNLDIPKNFLKKCVERKEGKKYD